VIGECKEGRKSQEPNRCDSFTFDGLPLPRGRYGLIAHAQQSPHRGAEPLVERIDIHAVVGTKRAGPIAI
jgi:hypothetical protein